jgi:crotonobetainyl-CoA:carnitine CoA-transferase CaiB-like acyl-CoA transferase
LSGAGSALAGRRVLEIADDRGSYCGKLLADLGAEVIKVEQPGGDPMRWLPPFRGGVPDPEGSLFFLYTNAGKRGVELDLERAEGREHFLRLAQDADAVIETLDPGELERRGLGWDVLQARNPGLVLTSITGFGQTGPHRTYRSTDLIASASGGAMYVIGDDADPPVRLAGRQAHVLASACAAASTLIALRHAGLSGRGQHVDISTQETTLAASLICGVGKWREDGIIPQRIGTGLVASVPSGAFQCKDGKVYLMVNRPAHWKALAQWIHEVTGNQEVLDPMFDGPSSARLPYRELLDLFIGEMTADMSVEQVYREGQRRHIAFTPLNRAADVAADRHLAARAFFVDVPLADGTSLRQPGPPYRLSRTPVRIERGAPPRAQHEPAQLDWTTARAPRPRPLSPDAVPKGALEGLRVVELGAGMAVPWLGRLMAWCGADVIKIESRGYPDVTRLYVPPRMPELGVQPQLSPWFTDWNAGKRFVALDLLQPDAVDLAKRLVARSDVLIENYNTGVLDKLGLGYEALRGVNPELVMLSSTGFGHEGPDCRNVTWGPNIEALTGLARFTGFPGGECSMTHFAYPDPLSALHGLVAVLAALEHRERGGGGQHVRMAQYETCVASWGDLLMQYLVNGEEPARLGNRSLHRAPHGCYPCRGEDRWCAIAVDSDIEWQALCRVLDLDDLAADTRLVHAEARIAHAAEIDARMAGRTREHDAHALMHALQAAGVAASAVQTTEDQIERDPHLAARGFFEQIEHLKKGPVTAVGSPLGLTGTPGRTKHAGEPIGRDNVAVFSGLLGLDAKEYERLLVAGAIEPADP